MRKIQRDILLVLTILMLVYQPAYAQTGSPSIQRDQILWSSGYWGPPGVNNPAHTLGPSWESKFMYEVLFDWNPVLDDPLVGFLGDTMEWSESGDLLTITLREVAKWSDNTTITADDVVYTFNEIYGAKNGPLNSTITQRIASIEKGGEFTVLVTPNPGYEFSKSIFFLFIGRWQILPAHIWPDVITYEAGFGNNKYQLTNNWLEDSFPDDLKVASGMYVPYSQAIDDSWSLYQRRDDWWGVGVLSDTLPAPKYIGMKSYPTNFAQNSEFVSGEIDWFGGYIQNIGREIELNPYLSTYYGDQEPYFASLSSIVEVVPNHHIYPLSEHWFREAMAYSLNIQDMIDIGVSGYLEQARVGRIDDRSPLLADLYDPSVEADYGFSYDLQKAKDIMNEHAVQVDGVWYTKDTPAEWQDDYEDALPNTAGFNVKIGPYTIEAPNGWSDFELHIETFQLQLKDLGIQINLETPEYSEFVGHSQSMNFELMLYGLGPGLLDTALTNFNYFTGPEGRGVNTTGWYNPTYAQLISQFETTVQGSEEEKNIAFQLQEEIGKELPSIPLFGNGYWYSYNTEYWVGWPTEDANVMPPMAMWAFGTTGLMNQLLWSLEANTGQSGGPTDDANAIPMFALMFSFVVLVSLKRKSRKHL